MRLLLSSYSLAPFPLEETFLFAQEIKADGLELVLMPSVVMFGLENTRKLSEKYGLPVLNLHQPPWGVLFTGERGIKKLIRQASEVGAQNIVAHLATMRRGFNSPFFEWIKEVEKEKGINIAFENAAPRELENWPSYAGHPEKLEKFVAERNVNLTLDVAKAFLKGIDPYQFFQKNHNNIKVIHAHGFDVNGDFHKSFLENTFDWPGFVSFVRKFDWPGAVTLEIFPLHRWVYFNLPSQSELSRAKEIIRESFGILRRV
ncbi:MAG: sugar phosphate isomerase/epimerase [Patescibacteria group bacterium]